MKNLALLFLLVLLQVLGNIWLSRGMRQLGNLTVTELSDVLTLGIQVLTNPWVMLGIGFQILSLALYLAAISRLDLSYVLPIMASSYVLTTFFAWLILNEQIAATRWMGTFLVSIGVMLASFTDGRRSQAENKHTRKGRQALQVSTRGRQ